MYLSLLIYMYQGLHCTAAIITYAPNGPINLYSRTREQSIHIMKSLPLLAGKSNNLSHSITIQCPHSMPAHLPFIAVTLQIDIYPDPSQPPWLSTPSPQISDPLLILTPSSISPHPSTKTKPIPTLLSNPHRPRHTAIPPDTPPDESPPSNTPFSRARNNKPKTRKKKEEMTTPIQIHYLHCRHQIPGFQYIDPHYPPSPGKENVPVHLFFDSMCDECDELPCEEPAPIQKPVKRSRLRRLRAMFRRSRASRASRSG